METSPEIHYISTDIIIRPATTHTAPTQRLELTPWDLNLLPINAVQKGLLFHKPKDATWLTNLKTSLSRTLHHFYPLAGRLATHTHGNNNISVFIQCNNAGVEFIHAKVDLMVSDILDPVYVPRIVHDFFPLNGAINYDGRSQPLLSIQVTELTDGVFIGCTMNHTIADGGSFWNFMNSWSEICKTGSDQISFSPAPNFDRWFIKETDLPIRFPVSRIENSIVPCTLPPLEERVFHFTPENIAKLKTKANLENNHVVVISSLQAVLAHVWTSVTRARSFDYDEVAIYRLLMSTRGRLNPPLPQGYFGNSVNSGFATAKVGELMTQGLGFAAGLLNLVVSSYSNAKICSAWENWVKEPKFLCFDDVQLQGNILVTGSSPRFNMYGNDFGWGHPMAVRSGCGNKFDGKMTVFPGAVNGSMEIEACLLPETLRRMGEDSEFMEFVGGAATQNSA